MLGLMQDWSMTLDKILTHAGTAHGNRRIAFRDQSSALRHTDYAAIYAGARRFSAALLKHGMTVGDRVATMLLNTPSHLIAWYGAAGMGVTLHTLNPRLAPVQIAWISRQAGNRVLVVEEQFLPILAEVADGFSHVELIVIATEEAVTARIGNIPAVSWNDFLDGATDTPEWGRFPEDTAAGLCYTSGTTGNPKGVLYSHRSNFLHALMVNQPDAFAIGRDDVVLPIVPMYHANAWALCFAAPLAGAALALPGPRLDGAALCELINQESVTFAAGVPTVCADLLHHIQSSGARVDSLKRMVIGGSAVTRELILGFETFGVEIIHGWGMTELSPLGALAPRMQPDLDPAAGRRMRQGMPVFPVEAEIFDEAGRACTHDDRTVGALKVRGPTVIHRYFGEDRVACDADGFFDTGDLAVIDEGGSILIVDRAKDVIKSGGEWISSVQLENAALAHPQIKLAAVVGVNDERWGERPWMVVETRSGNPIDIGEIEVELLRSVAKWWIPDKIIFDAIPLGSTGKIDKAAIRKRLLADAPRTSED
jgi:fatty-acyl-CoA synthase